MMRGQRRHLADAAQQGKTTVQVVPHRAGAHAGTTGPFVILDFPEPTDPAVVYVKTLAGDIYLEERSDVNRVSIDPVRMLRDIGDIAESIVAQLGRVDANVAVTVEIEAVADKGFTDEVRRTINENAQTLKFQTHEFEEG